MRRLAITYITVRTLQSYEELKPISSLNLFLRTVVKFPCTQDEIDVVDDFVGQHDHPVFLVAGGKLVQGGEELNDKVDGL